MTTADGGWTTEDGGGLIAFCRPRPSWELPSVYCPLWIHLQFL